MLRYQPQQVISPGRGVALSGDGDWLPREDLRYSGWNVLRVVVSSLRPSGSCNRQLPNLTEAGNKEAVRLMVRLGWPIAVTGGDWKASALNLAVYQGDADLTRFLLENGASWTERQGFDDNAHGTLCWASRNMDPANDYVGCARALIDHGLPILELDGDYSEEVAGFSESERKRLGS
jgi:hypothetical protein